MTRRARAADPIDFTDEDAVRAEMARALDIDAEELAIEEDRGLTGFREGTVYSITIQGGKRGTEWAVAENAEQARELAIAIVTQDLEHEPEIFNQSFIESHIDLDRLRRDLEAGVRESNEERLRDLDADDFWREAEGWGMDAPEEDEDGDLPEPDESDIEALADKQTDDQLRDPLSYLNDIYGREDAVKQAIEIAGIDVEAAAEEAVDTDGEGHFLSGYDGQTHETDGGLIYWRVN
jgi:hypothetical protein